MLLEAAKFPRYHIGESLIPSIRPYLNFIGAEEKLANHGFAYKPGSAIKFNQYKREGYTDFVALGHKNHAWNVVRSEFDQMLLNHARSAGVGVYEQTRVQSINFSQDDPSRPVSVQWSHTAPSLPMTPPESPTAGAFLLDYVRRVSFSTPQPPSTPPISESFEGKTTFDYVVDASGRTGVMAGYLKNRKFNESLRNIAIWGYWTRTGTYGKGTSREGAPWFEALADETGWAWFIPLHTGQTSVGIVMSKEAHRRKFNNTCPPTPRSSRPCVPPLETSPLSLLDNYERSLELAPGLRDLLGPNARLDRRSIKSASDYSYSSPSYAGPGYRLVGDAGCFIDPLFSSGIHLACTSALSAAASICAEVRGDCNGALAENWHTRRVSTSYTRFQLVVLSAYKQIRSQKVDVLCEFEEDNFDRAFQLIRPVIQGASDMGTQLSEPELQRCLDFCVKLFNPTTPDQHSKLEEKDYFTPEFLDVTHPVMDPSLLELALRNVQTTLDADEVDDERMVLQKINARRLMHREYGINNMESEVLDGWSVRLVRGKLGLRSLSVCTAAGEGA